MASAPSPITSPPDQPFQPYDATSEGTVGKWVSVDRNSGPASMTTGMATGDWPSADGWQQT